MRSVKFLFINLKQENYSVLNVVFSCMYNKETYDIHDFLEIYWWLILKIFHTKFCQKSCWSASCPVFKIYFSPATFRYGWYVQMKPRFSWVYEFLKKRCRFAGGDWFSIYTYIADICNLGSLQQILVIIVQRQLPYFFPTWEGRFLKLTLKIFIRSEITNVRVTQKTVDVTCNY